MDESNSDCSGEEKFLVKKFEEESEVSESSEGDEPETKEPVTKLLTCPYDSCDGVFTRNRKLINHIRIHTGERPFECDIGGCTKTYTNTSHLRRHKKTFHGEKVRIKCIFPGCDKELCDDYSLKRHYKRAHDPNRKYTFSCSECKQGFHRKRQLVQHSFFHTGELPYECEICHTRFATAGNCRRHKRTHTIYSCECGAKYERWTVLLAHRKTCIQSIFECIKCKKTFSSKSYLKIHEKTHQESILFTCSVKGCERFYIHKKNLDEHVRSVHENIKRKLPCPIKACKATFTKMENLKKHLERHDEALQKKLVETPQNDTSVWSNSTAASLAGLTLPPDLEKFLIFGNLDVEKLKQLPTETVEANPKNKLKFVHKKRIIVNRTKRKSGKVFEKEASSSKSKAKEISLALRDSSAEIVSEVDPDCIDVMLENKNYIKTEDEVKTEHETFESELELDETFSIKNESDNEIAFHSDDNRDESEISSHLKQEN